jgi:integrase/recombinase XerD
MRNKINDMITDMNLQGISPSTQESYLRRVNAFLEFTKKDIEDIQITDIRKYIIHLNDEKKLSSGTINAYISGLKFLFVTTLGRDWDKRIVPRMKGYKPCPAVLSKEEVFKIIDSINNIKYKAILTTIYGSGLRVSEVARLKVSDIDSKNFQILIRQTKNKRDRYAILSKRNLKLLRTYWLQCGRPKDWLFPGKNLGEHISVKSIKNFVLKLKTKLELKKNISAHTFRHCFATHLLESGVQLPHIQQLLGHSSIKTTVKYLHLTSKAMMDIKSPLDEGDDSDD